MRVEPRIPTMDRTNPSTPGKTTMHLRLVTFDLDGIDAEQNRPAAEAMAPKFAAWPGLVSKLWIADDTFRTLGGVYLFTDRAAADASRRSDEYLAVAANPHFANLRVEEFAVLDDLTAVTGGPLAETAGRS
jgi:hypothetical protein